MVSKYEIGDTVLISAIISGVEQIQTGQVIYKLRNIDQPVLEDSIVARLADGWALEKKR